MTVIVPIGRAISWQAIPRSTGLLTRLNTTASALRAFQGAKTDSTRTNSTKPNHLRTFSLHAARTFASKAAPRPKAHTGRSTTARSSPSTKKSTASKSKAKKKPVKKTKVKVIKKKKAPSATALKKAESAKRKDLRAKALLDEPKKLPENAWLVYFTENKVAKGTSLSLGAQHVKDVASNFRNISAEEHERLNHTANQNKAENEKVYKRWLSKYTPSEIKAANVARNQLAGQKKTTGKSRTHRRLIKDDRLVKRPANAYAHFHKARHASGDFKHMTVTESSRVIAKQWGALSSAEKQQYKDEAEADKNRYIEEYTSVYGTAPSITK